MHRRRLMAGGAVAGAVALAAPAIAQPMPEISRRSASSLPRPLGTICAAQSRLTLQAQAQRR